MTGRIPLTDLCEFVYRGETRWKGRALYPGTPRPAPVLVLAIGGTRIAIKATCPHAGREMFKGEICRHATAIECPSHGWQLPFTRLSGRLVIEDEDGSWSLGEVYVPPPQDDD